MYKIILILIISILFTTNVNTLYENKNIDSKSSVKNKISNKIVFNITNLFLTTKYKRDFISLNNLVQWKRRRRMTDDFHHIDNTNTKNFDIWLDKKSLVDNDDTFLIENFKATWPIDIWRKVLFSDDYLLLINKYWLRFPPPGKFANYFFGGLYIFMMFVGCAGNALVLVMYYKCRTLRTPGNILVANLALSDFLMLAKTPVFIINSFCQGPALGKTGCIIYGFLGGWTGTTSIATLAAIALDRYWAVVRPLEPLRALTAIRARFLAVGAWIYAVIFALIPALDIGYGRYVPEGYLTSCSFDYLTEELKPRYFIFAFFCAAWVVPFCTISFCYLNIFRVVVCKRHMVSSNDDNRSSSRHVKEQVKRKAEVKLAVLVIAVIALFFISWTPYAVVALLGIFNKKHLITPTGSMIPALFCKSTACINPFIYIITHPKFRKEFKRMFMGRSRRSDTMKSLGYYKDASKVHRPSRDLSDTEVEVVTMKDIPFSNEYPNTAIPLRTLSSRVTERQGSRSSISMESIEKNVVAPPSWYNKPQFSKKRRSTKSIISLSTELAV